MITVFLWQKLDDCGLALACYNKPCNLIDPGSLFSSLKKQEQKYLGNWEKQAQKQSFINESIFKELSGFIDINCKAQTGPVR